MRTKKSKIKPVYYLSRKEREDLEKEVQQKIGKLSTEKLIKVNQFIDTIKNPEEINYDAEKIVFLNTYKDYRTRQLYNNAFAHWEEFLSYLSNKKRKVKFWEINNYEMQEFINFFKAESIFTIIRDFSVFFLFHNYLVTKNNLKPYPSNYKNNIYKILRNVQKTSKPIKEKRRIPKPDEIEMVCEKLNERIAKLKINKSRKEDKLLNKTICTLFAIKIAWFWSLLPKDFENLRIEMNILSFGDNKLINLSLHPEIVNLAEVWVNEFGYFDSTKLARVNTQINDRVRKLSNAWTLNELVQVKKLHEKI